MNALLQAAWVAAGGALGALARYGLSGLVYRFAGSGFPWGTMVVNLLGSFLLGVTLVGLESALQSGPARAFVAIGFLGAFTTFSTFSYETLVLVQGGEWGRVAAYAGGSLVLGILAVALGFGTGSVLLFGRG